MAFEVDFTKVETALMELDKKARSSAIRQTLLKGADVVEREIKAEIKRQGHIEDGYLINSIQPTKLSVRGTSSNIRVGINPSAYNPKKKRKVTIYGFILQYGTKTKAGTYWLTKARDKSFDESREVIAKEIKRVLGI